MAGSESSSRRCGTGFTIIELMVVIAIIALLVSILLPSLSRAREISRRTVCLTNLRGIGQGMYIYAQDGERFPARAGSSAVGSMTIFDPNHRTAPGGASTLGTPSPTVDLWLLMRETTIVPKQFICPSTTDQPDSAQEPTAYYDFTTAANLSYAYHYQHSTVLDPIGPGSHSQFPVLADANPYIKGGVTSFVFYDRVGPGRGNSVNHTKREVSNVWFVDGHAVTVRDPAVGLAGKPDPNWRRAIAQDNIYSAHLRNQAVDPGSFRPKATECLLGDRSDACLVP